MKARDELPTGQLPRASAKGAKIWYLATGIDGLSRRKLFCAMTYPF
jgi:hypothetical protein